MFLALAAMFALGTGAGVAAVLWLTEPRAPDWPGAEGAAGANPSVEVERLQRQLELLRHDQARLRALQVPESFESGVTGVLAGELEAEGPPQERRDGGEVRQQMRQLWRDQRTQGELLTLRHTLGLEWHQVEDVQRLMQDRAFLEALYDEAYKEGFDAEVLLRIRQWQLRESEAMRVYAMSRVLAPGQFQTYLAMVEDRVRLEREARASRLLGQLATSVPLTGGQKDAVFQAYYQAIAEGKAGLVGGGPNRLHVGGLEALEASQQARLEAIGPLLGEAQLALFQEQLALEREQAERLAEIQRARSTGGQGR